MLIKIALCAVKPYEVARYLEVCVDFLQLFLKINAQNMAARHKSWQNGVWFSTVQEVLETCAGVRVKARECMHE